MVSLSPLLLNPPQFLRSGACPLLPFLPTLLVILFCLPIHLLLPLSPSFPFLVSPSVSLENPRGERVKAT